MTGGWVASLPSSTLLTHQDDPRAHGEWALEDLSVALRYERLGNAKGLLATVQSAALRVRAWRLSLPKGQQGERVSDLRHCTPRVLLYLAARDVIAADAGAFSGDYLRTAEAALRTLGKRLTAETD